MNAFLASLGMFGAAWVIHAVWWRSRPPARQLRGLVSLFGLVLLFALPFLHYGVSAAEIPGVLALYAGAAASYLILYTGIEQVSPTLVIVRELARAQGRGCSEEELAEVLTDDISMRPRVEALALDGILAPSGSGWALTQRGYRTARTARAIARVFRIKDVA